MFMFFYSKDLCSTSVLACFAASSAVSDTTTQVSLQKILIITTSLLLLVLLLLSILGIKYRAKISDVKHADTPTKSLLIATHTPSKSETTSIQEITPVRQFPELKNVIFESSSCRVWRGNFNGIDVAVKCLAKQSRQQWENELHIFSICNINHKNIVPFIAASDPESSELWLATEYCEQGTLQQFLQSHELSWIQLLSMAKDITAGLSFLHNDKLPLGFGNKPSIVHQDLKSNNILIKEDGTCAIADFGLSMELTEDYSVQLYQNGQVSIKTSRRLSLLRS